MFIHNIRTGFATNSSSTHSLVIWADGDTREAEVTSNYFGWDEFVLNSSREKLRYLQAIVRANATFAFGEPAANLIVETLTGPILGESDEMPDHQSHMTIPRDYSGKFFHLPFIQDLKSFLLRENVSVFGGNDNEDGTLHVGPESTQIPTSGFTPATSESTDPDLVAIKDAESGHYTFFNRGTGLRTIWSFDNVKPERSYNPILVDVKITDYCTFGCQECYMGSTPEGKHGDYNWISNLLYALGECEVLEVAFGGGETTLHPRFVDILETARRYNIVPNFTTRNLAWLKDDVLRERIFKVMGGFAFSVETADDVRKFAKAIEPYKSFLQSWAYNKATVQYIVGRDADESVFEDILRTCATLHIPITLLGFKTTGRGASFGEKPNPLWVDVVNRVRKDKYGLRVGIDTVLAQKGYDKLIDAGLDPRCVATTEGTFSCYVDAVKKRMYKSSYDRSEGVDLANPYRFHDHWMSVRS